MKWYVYILKCSDDSLYTGITKDINKRVDRHNKGRGAKYVLGKRPVTLMHKERFGNLANAMKREREIKSWGREKKLRLIKGP